ncbi:MAG: hypothetical protein [Wendovervirus sonii]|uniref:Uncharacterized protein n=1 Tax=phage Lak_Megaphage_Sonny TaxID=3109229 RepID=A0ABZ0Z695_9CAUD|nr:MAG: hypothetical protein [phage Lak_Megaphage_Sonny]
MYPAGYALMQVQIVTKEVFNLESDKEGWVSLCNALKKSKLMYRLSVEDFQIQFSNFLNHNT